MHTLRYDRDEAVMKVLVPSDSRMVRIHSQPTVLNGLNSSHVHKEYPEVLCQPPFLFLLYIIQIKKRLFHRGITAKHLSPGA